MLRCLVLLASAGCDFLHGSHGRKDAAPPDHGDGPTDVMADMPVPGSIAFVQQAVATSPGKQSAVAVAFAIGQEAGDFSVVVVSWGDGNDSVMSVSDTAGNTYVAATGLVQAGSSMRIYAAANIKAGPNTVTATLSAKVTDPKLRVFEYAGLAATAALDGNAAASGAGTLAVAGPIGTSNAHDLLFAATTVSSATAGPGTGYTQRQLDAGDLVEDRIVSAAGAYTADAPLNPAGNWVMQMAAFKGAP